MGRRRRTFACHTVEIVIRRPTLKGGQPAWAAAGAHARGAGRVAAGGTGASVADRRGRGILMARDDLDAATALECPHAARPALTPAADESSAT
jgi:hypothetical protein